jgi:hypothetical protein
MRHRAVLWAVDVSAVGFFVRTEWIDRMSQVKGQETEQVDLGRRVQEQSITRSLTYQTPILKP